MEKVAGRDPNTIKNRIEEKHRKLRGKGRVVILKGEIENYFKISVVADELKIPLQFIDQEKYDEDPKVALRHALELAMFNGVVGARRYEEKRHSQKIADRMSKEDILSMNQIMSIINTLLNLAGERLVVDATDNIA